MADTEELDELDVPKKSKLPLILGVVSALLLGGAGGFGGDDRAVAQHHVSGANVRVR